MTPRFLFDLRQSREAARKELAELATLEPLDTPLKLEDSTSDLESGDTERDNGRP